MRQCLKSGYIKGNITRKLNFWKEQLVSHEAHIVSANDIISGKTPIPRGHYGYGYDAKRDLAYYTKEKQSVEDHIAEYAKITIVEEEVESPNIATLPGFETELFDTNAIKQGYCSIEKHETHTGRSFCRVCGMKLKKIPYVKVGGWRKNIRVCAFCIVELQGFVETAFEKMPADWKEEIEGQRFVHRLGENS